MNIPRVDWRAFLFKNDLRKRKLETMIMNEFLNEKSELASPKKEYVRCKVIRGHKKMIRSLITSKIPKNGIVKLSLNDKTQSTHYRNFQDHLFDNMPELESISKTESGPSTDGKTQREKLKLEATDKSFNNQFCVKYFSSEAVRKSFYIFVELVFSKLEPEDLKERFGFRCCKSQAHCLDCLEKWMMLKFYLQDELFVTLGYEKPSAEHSGPSVLPNINNLDFD